MARIARSLFVAIAAFGMLREARARDLPKSDRDRSAILDSARGVENIKFVVKDLFKIQDLAFLCAMKKKPAGDLVTTEGKIAVHQWALLNDEGRWIALGLATTAFSSQAGNADCRRSEDDPSEDLPTTREEIAAMLSQALTVEIQADIEHGRIEDKNLDLLRRFTRAKILTDVAIEERKRGLNRVEGYEAEDRCRNPKCRADAKTDFRELGRAASDPKVSSLVWFNCQFGLRANDLGAARNCVTALSQRPYCRPGMKIAADRRDIDRCLDEIRQLCHRTFPGEICK